MKDEALLWHDSCHGNIVITLLMACLLWASIPLLIIGRSKFRLGIKDGKEKQSFLVFRVTNVTFTECHLSVL